MLLTKRWTAASGAGSVGKKRVNVNAAVAERGNEDVSSRPKLPTETNEAVVLVTEHSASHGAGQQRQVPKQPPTRQPPTQEPLLPKKKEIIKARRRRHKRMVELNSKEPEAASNYLKAWNVRDSPSGTANWKFNKATQAWFLRHAYETAKVSKDTFLLLLRYIRGLRGAARTRLRDEASVIVAMRGAPLINTVPTQNEDAAASKRKRRRTENDGSEAATAETGTTTGDGEATPQLDKAEAKTRAVRLKRAKKLLTALADSDEAPGAE
jgi:hypothetical protein